MMNRSSKLSSLLALGLLLFAVLACNRGGSENAIPADKKDYIGDWRGQTGNESMKLNIASDGTVNYERKRISGTESIEASRGRSISGGKISKFEGNDFVVKVLLVSTTFKVEKPPYREGPRWKMVVDGVEVSRKDANSTEVSIATAEMRKDDGTGKMSDEVTDTFTQSDRMFHCTVTLDNPKAGTRVKFVFITVDAGDNRNEVLKEVTAEITADREDQVDSWLKLKREPPKGDYKVDIYLNDKLEQTLHFTVI